MAKLAEILTGPETWCKHTLEIADPFRRRCLIGALMVFVPREELEKERLRLSDVISQVTGQSIVRSIEVGGRFSPSDGIAHWQDAKERTWDDIVPVIEAYDRDRLLNP